MEQPVAVFEPLKSGNYTLIWVLLAVAATGIAFLVFNYKRGFPNLRNTYRQLFSLLAFFVVIISLVTAFFSFWSAQKLVPVAIYPHLVETAYGKAEFRDIARVYIYEDRQRSRVTREPAGDVTRLLIIEEIDRKSHVLSEENYDIDSVFQVLSRFKDEQ